MSEQEDASKGKSVAKLDIGATAKYSRTRTTTEVIPPDVTRAKAGAWLDLISPITEWAGLQGDQLRHKRELLRLQQEETLLAVGQAAQSRLRELGRSPNPIPTKALVPILERASLEQGDSELIEAWGNLLASASADFDSEVITFSSILSEIGARERTIIETMVPIQGLGVWADRLARSKHGTIAEFLIKQQQIKSIVQKALAIEDFQVFESLKSFMPLGYPALIFRVTRSAVIGNAIKPELIFEAPFYSANSAGFEVLDRQGLIRQSGAGFTFNHSVGEMPISISWYEFTELGFAFVLRIVARASKKGA